MTSVFECPQCSRTFHSKTSLADHQHDTGHTQQKAILWKTMIIPAGGPYNVEEALDIFDVTAEDAMNNQTLSRTKWIPDSTSSRCMIPGCASPFPATLGLFYRRHHCRRCGILVCNDCSPRRMRLPPLAYHEPVRVCKDCCAVLSRNPYACVK